LIFLSCKSLKEPLNYLQMQYFKNQKSSNWKWKVILFYLYNMMDRIMPIVKDNNVLCPRPRELVGNQPWVPTIHYLWSEPMVLCNFSQFLSPSFLTPCHDPDIPWKTVVTFRQCQQFLIYIVTSKHMIQVPFSKWYLGYFKKKKPFTIFSHSKDVHE
jgi:hypothetical protein